MKVKNNGNGPKNNQLDASYIFALGVDVVVEP